MSHPLDRFHYCPQCGSIRFSPFDFKAKRCSDCGFTLYMNASAAVAAFILNEHRELLVCRRKEDPAKGTLDLPGGFVDMGETMEEALFRELKEELNVEITESKYLFSQPNIYVYSGLDIPTIDFFFLCEVKSFETLRAADDVESVSFLPINKIYPEDFGLDSVKRSIIAFLKSI